MTLGIQTLGVSDFYESERLALELTNRVFDRLRSSGIQFCLLRNRSRIPAGLIQGSDVDVVVPRNLTFDMLERLFLDFRPIQVIRQQPGAGIKFCFRTGDILVGFDFLNGDREWFGATYLSNEALLNDAVEDSGLPVASAVHQAFDAWFAGLLWSDTIKPRYVNLVEDAAQNSPDEFCALLADCFGKQLGTQLFGYTDNGRLEQSIKSAHKLRKALWHRSLRRAPIKTITRASLYIWRRATLRIHPPGVSVAILGPDGAGKSTVCQSLVGLKLPDSPFSHTEVIHIRRRVLPSPRDLINWGLRSLPSSTSVTDRDGAGPHTIALSCSLALYDLIDQWLSVFLYERQSLARNHLLVYDRHMAELNVEPLGYRFRAPIGLARLVARLGPQPNLLIVLDALTETLPCRKQEVSIEETSRQRIAYRALANTSPAGSIVDASQPIEQVVADVKLCIIRFLTDRTMVQLRSSLELKGPT